MKDAASRVLPIVAAFLIQSTMVFADDKVDNEQLLGLHDRTVLLIERRDEEAEKFYFSSAFIIAHRDTLFLVAPRGQAKLLTGDAALGCRGETDGSEQWTTLHTISNWEAGGGWFNYEDKATFSVLALTATDRNAEAINHLRKVAIPIEMLSASSPERTSRVEVVGYSASRQRSERQVPPPFVVTMFVASKEMVYSDETAARFVWISPASDALFPGGPVFFHPESATKTECIGLFLGDSPSDRDKGLGVLVPARYVATVIRQIADKK